MYVEDFHEHTGVTVPVPGTVGGVFKLIFDQVLIDHIVRETNRYARTVMGDSKYENWEKLGTSDIYAYFGIMIMMGLVNLPCLWRKDTLFYCPAIADKMSRDRFLEIHKYLHFTNNEALESNNDDRLWKVREVLDMMQSRFVSLYDPHRECAIDEAMVPYKGRSSLKQYMPKKPVRRGLKVWLRADSLTGYVSQLQVYVGREISPERGLGARVVKDLTRSLVNKHYHIFCDNFFSSVGLFHELHEQGLYATGTLRSDRRGFPTELKLKAKKGFAMRGESESRHSTVNSNLTVSVWQDTKPVTVCSTFCQTVPVDEVERKLKNGEHRNFPCPHAITTYNKYMGGVDKNDQLREYYHVRLKSRKYYKYLFWMVFDISITNAMIIAKSNPDLHQDIKSTKAFRTALSHQLLEGYCSKKRKGRRPSELTKKFRKAHYPILGDGKQHRCFYCSQQKKRRDTKWFCPDCNLYLCHKGHETDCFLQYHIHYVSQ